MVRYDIVIFGATGYTGSLMVQYIADHPDLYSKLSIAAAARTQHKLASLVQNAHLPGMPTIVCDVNDPKSLHDMCAQAKVLINCVGPFAKWGEATVRACLDTKTDYVDITGEEVFIHDMVVKYHQQAVEQGTLIIPACGFDSIPADILYAYARDQLSVAQRRRMVMETRLSGPSKKDPNGPGGSLSHGTFQTVLNVLGGVAGNAGAPPADADPSNYTHISRGTHWNPHMKKYVMPFELLSDAYVVRRSNHLLSASEHEPVEFFEYGHYMTVSTVAAWIAPWVMFFGSGALALLCKFPPTRKLLQGMKGPGEGPSPEARANGMFGLECSATSLSATEPVTKVCKITGAYGGYDFTAIAALASAAALVEDRKALRLQGGVATPASALGKHLTSRLQNDVELTCRDA